MSKLVIVFFLSFLAIGCGNDSPADSDANPSRIDAAGNAETCNFDNCDGCCDGTTCVTTATDSECGLGGAACNSCTMGTICIAGGCVADIDCDMCAGCCLGGTQCLEGNTQAACGSVGSACIACPDGQGCNDGLCEATACDASNCANGCCTANGECITVDEQTVDACGQDAQACNVCAQDSTSCTLGTCVAPDQPCLDFCDDGCCTDSGQCIPFADQDQGVCGASATCSACSGDLSCLDGTCIGDPVWQITVVSAVIAPSDANGNDWDESVFSNPLPDVYVGGRLANSIIFEWFTETIDDTLTPNWNSAEGLYLESDIVTQGLTFVVRDSDGLGSFESIGSCTYVFTAGVLQAGGLNTVECGTLVSSLNLTFTRQN